jgi:nucleoside-diphosphate-sugar epimerase
LVQRVLVTGANGFIGLPLCALLARSGLEIVAGVRRPSADLAALTAPGAQVRLRQVELGDIGAAPEWSSALAGVDAVVHLAARVHILGTAPDPAAFHRVNVEGTLRLAEAAACAGVKRLVYISSVKAKDDSGDPYGESKAEAEERLGDASRQLGLASVIVRPPLVYGPRVRANFLRLMRLVDSGVPLPLASVANRRSLVYVGNLVDALHACVTHPDASGGTFEVSDGEDVSTPDLVRRIAQALGRPARLFPFPIALLRIAAAAAGQLQAIDRLTGDLSVDASPIRSALGWRPPYSMQQGLAETAAWYIARHRKPQPSGMNAA